MLKVRTVSETIGLEVVNGGRSVRRLKVELQKPVIRKFSDLPCGGMHE